MERKFTPGPWMVGEKGGCVVSLSNEALTISGSFDEDSAKYYGGYLIGESITTTNATLIAQAPTMLDALAFETIFLSEIMYKFEQLDAQSYVIQKVKDRIGKINEILKEAIDGKV